MNHKKVKLTDEEKKEEFEKQRWHLAWRTLKEKNRLQIDQWLKTLSAEDEADMRKRLNEIKNNHRTKRWAEW